MNYVTAGILSCAGLTDIVIHRLKESVRLSNKKSKLFSFQNVYVLLRDHSLGCPLTKFDQLILNKIFGINFLFKTALVKCKFQRTDFVNNVVRLNESVGTLWFLL